MPTMFYEYSAEVPGEVTTQVLGGATIRAEREDEAALEFEAWLPKTWPGIPPHEVRVYLERVTELRWPVIFPEVPREITDAMSLWYTLATDAAGRVALALAGEWSGHPGIAQGQAMAFESAGYHLAEDLARGAWYEGADALKWAQVR